MRKLYPGMVPMKKNPQQQKAADNLAGKRAMLEAIHPMPKYEKEQREKVFLEHLNQTVYVEIGHRKEDWIPIGVVKDYMNLNVAETAKLIYKRINRNRATLNVKTLEDCTEYAQEIRGGVLKEHLQQ